MENKTLAMNKGDLPLLDLKKEIEKLEKSSITQALERSQGNHARAARLLNINRTTLLEKMKRYGFKLGEPIESIRKYTESRRKASAPTSTGRTGKT